MFVRFRNLQKVWDLDFNITFDYLLNSSTKAWQYFDQPCVIFIYPQYNVPSHTWEINMSRGMSDRSSEVRAKHAVAGTEGHSHLVIWVNYKWGSLQQGKMSWTAVSSDTHINRTTAHMHGPLHWAPDPWSLSWLKSPLQQPGRTGEKFTITPTKIFFTLSVFFSSFIHRASQGNARLNKFLGFVYCNCPGVRRKIMEISP